MASNLARYGVPVDDVLGQDAVGSALENNLAGDAEELHAVADPDPVSRCVEDAGERARELLFGDVVDVRQVARAVGFGGADDPGDAVREALKVLGAQAGR